MFDGERLMENIEPSSAESEDKTEGEKGEERRGAVGVKSLKKSIRIIFNNPAMLIPAVLGAVIYISIFLGLFWFYNVGIGDIRELPESELFILAMMGITITFGGVILSFVLNIASLDMARDAYLNRDMNLLKSLKYITKNLGTFLMASLLGALLSFVVYLAPLAILILAVLIVDEEGVIDSILSTFKVIKDRFSPSILIILISIIAFLLIDAIPIVGPVLNAMFNVFLGLTFIDLYSDYKLELKKLWM